MRHTSKPDLTVFLFQFDSTPLHTAAGKGHCDVVTLLLERGASPNLAKKVAKNEPTVDYDHRINQYSTIRLNCLFI